MPEPDPSIGGDARTRRSYLEVEAVNPADGTRFKVLLSEARLRNIASRSRGQILEARDLVPFTLQYPTAVFEGLRRETDEPVGRGAGWRCYVSVPIKAFRKDGTETNPYPGEVYLVFVTADRIAYNWYWTRCDAADKTLPDSWESRFVRKLL